MDVKRIHDKEVCNYTYKIPIDDEEKPGNVCYKDFVDFFSEKVGGRLASKDQTEETYNVKYEKEIQCAKCKKKTLNKDTIMVKKNKKTFIKAKCIICNSNKIGFITKVEFEELKDKSKKK